MSLNMSFSSNDKYESSKAQLLKPWDIYEVKFLGAEFTSIVGKKDPTATYDILKFTFANEDGQYIETLFCPKAGDEVRGKKTNKNGHEVDTPSNLDYFKFEIGQLLSTLCPKALEKLSASGAHTPQDIMKFVAGNLKNVVGTTVFIKLIGNNKNQPRFPYFLSIFESDPEPKVTNNFISTTRSKLAFTDFETQQKEKIEKATPTEMATTVVTPTQGSEDAVDRSLDLDLDL